MIYLTIFAEDKVVFQRNVPLEVLVRTRLGTNPGTFLMINKAMIHNIVAYRMEQQIGVEIQPPPSLTIWVQKGQEANVLGTLKLIMELPRGA